MKLKVYRDLLLIAMILALSFYVVKNIKQQTKAIKDLSTFREMDILNEQLVSLLKIFTTRSQNKNINLIRHGKNYDGGYVVAEKSLAAADVVLGYGIDKDNSFEENFSNQYTKPSYGFDCGIESIESHNKLFTFVKECIASDAFIYKEHTSSKDVSSFDMQISKLGLENKKIFIKMDIEGAEYQAFEDILKHQANITGIALEIHFNDQQSTTAAIKLLTALRRNFVLIHVHGNNCCIKNGIVTKSAYGVIPHVIELSYIHKSLVDEYFIADDQSHPLLIDMPNLEHKADAVFEVIK